MSDKKPKKKRARKYDEKLAVNADFATIMKASVKHAEKNSAPKKKG